MKFALDTPNGGDLGRIERFSGWCLTDAGLPADSIILRVNGLATVQLERTPRWDLVSAFPQFPEAVNGGFAGDLALPEHVGKGSRTEVELVVRIKQVEYVLGSRTFRVVANEATAPARQRSYRLEDILEQLPAASAWDPAPKSGGSRRSATWPAFALGAAHFHDAGEVPTLRVLEEGPTNPYSKGSLAVIDATPASGLFLDLGCGIRRQEDMRSNGVYLDAVHFRGVDIVSTQARLPLRDRSVDTVVSLSVFEHLPDPFAMAAEIRRVLKPGGTVWIETAFMQPMHADPGHYFNMTLQGLLRTFAGFAIDDCGVLPHHLPSNSLRMQLNHVLPYMQEGEWKQTLQEWLARLTAGAAALDAALGPIGHRTLAAGVFIRGRNTGAG